MAVAGAYIWVSQQFYLQLDILPCLLIFKATKLGYKQKSGR
jgi:hypothetical protein